MKKTAFALLVLILLAGCGQSQTVQTGKTEEPYDPYKPVKNYDPGKTETIVDTKGNAIPGKGLLEFETQTTIEALDLPGRPVLIKDKYFTVLFGSTDKKNTDKLIELLKKDKIAQLENLVMASTDPVYLEGINELLQKFPVLMFDVIPGVDSEPLRNTLKIAKEKKVMTEDAISGAKWMINGTLFDIIYPLGSDVALNPSAIQHCVMRVEKKDLSAILTCQLDAEVQEKLIARNKLTPSSYLVITGAKTENTFEGKFLEAVKPKNVISSPTKLDMTTKTPD
jgi:beta-lactamase superfamily II metal-dependent hydrolase